MHTNSIPASSCRIHTQAPTCLALLRSLVFLLEHDCLPSYSPNTTSQSANDSLRICSPSIPNSSTHALAALRPILSPRAPNIIAISTFAGVALPNESPPLGRLASCWGESWRLSALDVHTRTPSDTHASKHTRAAMVPFTLLYTWYTFSHSSHLCASPVGLSFSHSFNHTALRRLSASYWSPAC